MRRCHAGRWCAARVYTAADIPAARRVGIIHKDWPVMIPEGGRTSYLGDVLAVVVAETRQIARAAAELVVTSITTFTSPWSTPCACGHSDEPAVWELDGNVLSTSAYSRGDVDAAARRVRIHGDRDLPDPTHRARLPRARIDARRPVGRRLTTARCTCIPAARASGMTATTSRRCSGSRTTHHD